MKAFLKVFNLFCFTAVVLFAPASHAIDFFLVNASSGGTIGQIETGRYDFTVQEDSEGLVRAFPEANGYGAYAKGGRGGRVIEVTNLNASGPGSFMEACHAKGPRTIVFRVGGTIRLNTRLSIRNPYVTIAGQTAPGDGICIRGGTLLIATHDVVVRYLRIRVGDGEDGPEPENRDALSIAGRDHTIAYNVVVDHCSFCWAIDENVSTWFYNQNITFQWCIISEGLRYPYSDMVAPHSMGMLLGSRESHTSVHHCLFAHNWDRNPFVGNDEATPIDNPSVYDIRYNVIYNYGKYSCGSVRGRSHVNYVGNYYVVGPDGNENHLGWIDFTGRDGQKIYDQDNWWINSPTPENSVPKPEVLSMDDTRKPLTPAVKASAPFDAPYVTRYENNFDVVLHDAGANLPKRDTVDRRLVDDVRNQTGAVINSQDEVGGWPDYQTGDVSLDSDHDGMPDSYENQMGYDPRSPDDATMDDDGNGYTNLEDYLNDPGNFEENAGN